MAQRRGGRGDLPITLAMFAFLLSSDPRRALRASMDARCAARVRSPVRNSEKILIFGKSFFKKVLDEPMGARDSSLPRGLTWLYRT